MAFGRLSQPEIERIRAEDAKHLQDDPLTTPLTGREWEVVQQVANGLRNRQIALALGLSEGTVKCYLSRVFDKLGVDSRLEVVLWATRAKLNEVQP